MKKMPCCFAQWSILSALTPPSPSPPFLGQSSLTADRQERLPNHDAPHLSCLPTTGTARHGAKSAPGHRSTVPLLKEPASKKHKDLHVQGKDFLTTCRTHTKNSSWRKSHANAVYFAGCGARTPQDMVALIGNMTPHMKGSKKNNEMVLISLTVPGWPSLLCCHQMASALLLLPDQPGPGLQKRKSTVWHEEALDATTLMFQAAFSIISCFLSLFFFPPHPLLWMELRFQMALLIKSYILGSFVCLSRLCLMSIWPPYFPHVVNKQL